jgi:hypothetical protein
MKPAIPSLADVPPRDPIAWREHEDAIHRFTMEVLQTLGRAGVARSYPINAYTLRLVAIARARLWARGCALRVQTNVDSNRLYVRADFSTARAFRAWRSLRARKAVAA